MKVDKEFIREELVLHSAQIGFDWNSSEKPLQTLFAVMQTPFRIPPTLSAIWR